MNRLKRSALSMAVSLSLLGGSGATYAAVNVQCPGDKNGDADWNDNGEKMPGEPGGPAVNTKCLHLIAGDSFVKMSDGNPLYTFGFGEDHTLGATGGIIDSTDYLDENAFANDEYTQFMSEALVNGQTVYTKNDASFRSVDLSGLVLDALRDGSIDIVIGTHRLIQRDIRFKRLGLVIIDEEQRFGVQQKERLKQLRAEVDLLTLTATPIPRTLQLAFAGLRDLSVINTPPADRLS